MRQIGIFTAILLGLVFAASKNAVAEDFWIKTEGSGCEIYSDEPAKEGDFVAWSGRCDAEDKATGFGLAVWLRDGKLYARYSGEMIGGRLHGRDGLLLLQSDDGSRLDVVFGSFANGQADGPVTAMGADGSLFKGTYDDGKRNGRGLIVDKSGNSFQGNFRDDMANGAGRSISADGEEYVGTFKDNNRHGSGLVYTKDGHIYSGGFEDDMFAGEGRYEGPNGYFEGTYSGNKPNGTGKLVSNDGKVMQGTFVDGEPDGIILVTMPDGSQTTETWKDGKKINE